MKNHLVIHHCNGAKIIYGWVSGVFSSNYPGERVIFLFVFLSFCLHGSIQWEKNNVKGQDIQWYVMRAGHSRMSKLVGVSIKAIPMPVMQLPSTEVPK